MPAFRNPLASRAPDSVDAAAAATENQTVEQRIAIAVRQIRRIQDSAPAAQLLAKHARGGIA